MDRYACRYVTTGICGVSYRKSIDDYFISDFIRELCNYGAGSEATHMLYYCIWSRWSYFKESPKSGSHPLSRALLHSSANSRNLITVIILSRPTETYLPIMLIYFSLFMMEYVSTLSLRINFKVNLHMSRRKSKQYVVSIYEHESCMNKRQVFYANISRTVRVNLISFRVMTF